ncbi:hypothetical protein Tco_0693526 [Tanacetum coccineum]
MSCMIVSCILLPLNKSERLKRIIAREEVAPPLPLHPPSVNHPPLISTNDGNGEGTSRASTPSPTQFVNSLTNEVPRVFSNPPNIDPNMKAFYTRQTEILNRKLQLRDEKCSGKVNREGHQEFMEEEEKLNNYLHHALHHLHHISLYLLYTSMASTQASSSNPSKKLKLTIITPRQLFMDLTSEEDDTTTPSPITKSSSPSPPNAPSKTPSTKDTSSTCGTTSSSFESKPQSSPPSFNDTPFPQPSNPFINDIMDVPPRPSNPIPLQSHPSLNVTLFVTNHSS